MYVISAEQDPDRASGSSLGPLLASFSAGPWGPSWKGPSWPHGVWVLLWGWQERPLLAPALGAQRRLVL